MSNFIKIFDTHELAQAGIIASSVGACISFAVAAIYKQVSTRKTDPLYYEEFKTEYYKNLINIKNYMEKSKSNNKDYGKYIELITNKIKNEEKDDECFERFYLEKYYRDALYASQVTLHFSIIFACIGFVFVIYSFFHYNPLDVKESIFKSLNGCIIDLVSALFFVQSNKARKNMGSFFDKLRIDRMQDDAKRIIESIDDRAVRDQLKMQVVLKFVGVEQLLNGRK